MRVVALVPLMLVAGGCRPREERVKSALERARPSLGAVAACLANAGRVLPPEENAQDGCFAQGIPPISADLRPQTSGPGSLDVMMVDDAGKPWAPTSAEHPMARSSRLAEPMGWIVGGVAVPGSVSGGDVEKKIDVALGIHYVLLFRVTDYQDPVALSVSEFNGGSIGGVFYLVDLSASKVLCMLPFVAKNDDNLFYFKVQGNDVQEKLKNFEVVLRENLYGAARNDAFKRLETLIPGSRIYRY
ncbi:MAG: hypothetical protein U0166_25125 [Acidobacteriota bacterium]